MKSTCFHRSIYVFYYSKYETIYLLLLAEVVPSVFVVDVGVCGSSVVQLVIKIKSTKQYNRIFTFIIKVV